MIGYSIPILQGIKKCCYMFSDGGIVMMLENNSDGIDVVKTFLVCGNEKEHCI